MKNFSILVLVLALIGIGDKAIASDSVNLTVAPLDDLLLLAARDAQAISKAKLPKGVRTAKNGIVINKNSGIRVKQVSKSQASLSGGSLGAKKQHVSCNCGKSGSCNLVMREGDPIGPSVQCKGECDDCYMMTQELDDDEVMIKQELGLNQSKDCGVGELPSVAFLD